MRITGIRQTKTIVYNIRDKYGLSLLTRLRVKFSDLRQHRFNHHFNCPSELCLCGTDNESNEHFLLRCPRFSIQRRVLLDSVSDILQNDINNLQNDVLTELLLYGSNRYNIIANKLLLESTIRYLKSTKRFKTIEAYEHIYINYITIDPFCVFVYIVNIGI